MLLKNNMISRISKLTIKFEFNDMDLMKIIVRGSNPKIVIYKNLNETLLIYLTKIYIKKIISRNHLWETIKRGFFF
jgi:hypothetical protein